MSDQPHAPRDPSRSYASMAEVYDSARPGYPAEAVSWLAGSEPLKILELGAGTGKLTELLVAAGHSVVASEPLPEMLALLRERVPSVRAVVATAERIPLPSRSVDLVVCAESFHWFDHDVALPEIARVLKPGGHLAMVWNFRDEGIPWVKKFGRIIGVEKQDDLSAPAAASDHFGLLEESEFRFWQSLRRNELTDLARSRSSVAVMEETQRNEVLARVGALYDDYGRGPDGMQLPYLTRCYKVVVDHQAPAPVVMSPAEHLEAVFAQADANDPEATQAMPRPVVPPPAPPEDTGTLLIDFR